MAVPARNPIHRGLPRRDTGPPGRGHCDDWSRRTVSINLPPGAPVRCFCPPIWLLYNHLHEILLVDNPGRSMSPPRIHSILLVFTLTALISSGCGTFRNATAYFNTYYNASHLFDQAVAELEKAPQPARDSNYFAPYKTPAGTVKKFESVIEKGSKVIQFHGESGYVQDAILMIGKSYLYQNETESAGRKFKELLDNFQGSDKVPEARLWYAKSLYMGKNDEEALIAVKELTAAGQSEIDGLEVDDDLLLEGLMLEAQIYADRGEAEIAGKTLARIRTLDGDGRLKAIAQYQFGMVNEMTGAYTDAAAAYDAVSDFSPDTDMKFKAKLQKGVMLSMAGEHERALETFDEIIEWPLKKTQSALVDFEIANTYWAMGDSAAAFTLYDIIDSSYKKTDAAARAYFKRGDILQHTYLQLEGAKEFYGKARSEYPASPVTAEARVRFTSLDHYFKTHASLAKDDSLFYAMVHTDSGGTVARPGSLTEDTAASTGKSGITEAGAAPDRGAPVTEGETQQTPRGQLQAIGGLSMRALRAIPRHLVADPEDAGVLTGLAENGAGGGEPGSPPAARSEEGKPSPGGKGKTKTPPPAPKTPPKAALTPEKLAEKIAAERYELGGVLLLDLGLPDSALMYYEQIVRDHPTSVLVPKALYAISEVHRTLGDSAMVDSLYDLILAEHPRTEYAGQVRKTRGLDTVEAVDSPALARYREAEAKLFGDDPDGALAMFREIYETTTDSVVRPKACYAIGWVFENVVVELDSAESWYKRLMKSYPSSEYAANAKPRVLVRGDTSKLKDFVKIKEIRAIPKPTRKALGLIPTGKVPVTATQNVKDPKDLTLDDVDYYDEELDVDPDDEDEGDNEDDGEPDDPDDPGGAGGASGPDILYLRR